MSASPHETLLDEKPPLPSERSTGLVLATAAAIAAVVFRETHVIALPATAVAALLAIAALVAPSLLGPLNRAWFALALLLNRVVSPVVMLVLFAGLIVPAGLVMQRLRDPLARRRRPEAASYWVERTATAPSSTMRDQF